MERVIKHLEEKLSELELQICTREEGLKARKNFGTEVGLKVRAAKKQSKVLSSAGQSTAFIDRAKAEFVELIIQNDSILSHLKRDKANLQHEAFCLRKAVEALKSK